MAHTNRKRKRSSTKDSGDNGGENTLESISKSFVPEIVEKPEIFVSKGSEELREAVVGAIKSMYDYGEFCLQTLHSAYLSTHR